MRSMIRPLAVMGLLAAIAVPGGAKAAPGAWSPEAFKNCGTNPTVLLHIDVARTALCSVSASADGATGRLTGRLSLSGLGGGSLPGNGSANMGAGFAMHDVLDVPNSVRTYTFTFRVAEARVISRPGVIPQLGQPGGGIEFFIEAFPEIDRDASDGFGGEQKFSTLALVSTETIDKDVAVQVTVHAGPDVGQGVPVNIDAAVHGGAWLGSNYGDLGVGSITATFDATLTSVQVS